MNTETIIQNLKLVESITAQTIWENLVWGIFNIVLAALLKNIKNLPLICVKLCDWKNRRLYSGVILNKVKKESFQYFIHKTKIYCMELISCYLNVVLFLFILWLAAIFRSIDIGIIQELKGAFIIGGIILGIPVIVSIFKNNCWRHKKNIFIFVFAETILFILLFVFQINNVQHFYIMVSLITYFSIMIFIFTSSVRREHSSYNTLNMIISKVLRNTMWIIILYSYCIDPNVDVLNTASRIWGSWCSIEYLCAVHFDDRYVVDVIIYLKDRKDVVRDKILKCHGNKIRYTSVEGKTVIVSLDRISKILIENYWSPNIKFAEKEQSALLIDGTKMLFHDYKCINESWTAFYIYEDEEKKTIIYHNEMFNELVFMSKGDMIK